MGLFKKAKRLVKKVTKPVAKVLDKVIPNEIKPALPYLAAFAPYMLPAGAGAGLASLGINNPMLQRAILTGGINLGSQLAQEGSEGDFSALSLGLAGLQGALTAPNAATDLRAMANPGSDVVGAGADAAEFATDQSFLGGLKEKGLNLAATGAEKLSGIQSVLSDPNKLLSMEGLKASAIPVIQGTSDLALADARRALKAYEDELAAFNLEAGEATAASNAARRNAIIAAMTGNHAEDVIEATLAELGLKDGGIARLGFSNGGSGTPVYLDDSLFKDKDYLTLSKDASTLEEELKKLIATEDVPSPSKYETIAKLYEKTSDKGDKFGERIDEEVEEKYPNADVGDIDPFDRYPMEVLLIEKILEKQGKTIDDLNEEYGELLEKKGLRAVADKIARDYYSKVEKQANGGIVSLNMGGSVLPSGTEMDYRGGGMIPMGSKERADDVPARLSKNEFVMTADAVKAAGGGSVNEGAKRMYNLMHNLEARV
tara:strand:- start:953 stop:2410 length:1458 start_codon:yes stop_codon:yes gene_type:complete